jgi:hypothetical protein
MMSQELNRQLRWHEYLALEFQVMMCEGGSNFR